VGGEPQGWGAPVGGEPRGWGAAGLGVVKMPVSPGRHTTWGFS